MKQKAILTLALHGADREFSRSIFCIEKYCKKYNIDFFLITQPIINGPHLFFEKFNFVDLLNKYEQVCYIDVDTLITPHARDIFYVCNNNDINKYIYNI